jgi:hypothetical protein
MDWRISSIAARLAARQFMREYHRVATRTGEVGSGGALEPFSKIAIDCDSGALGGGRFHGGEDMIALVGIVAGRDPFAAARASPWRICRQVLCAVAEEGRPIG